MAGTCKRQSKLLESGIGELSLLPLFLDLKGKRVLVIGASQGAKWKVELLGSAGAIVDQLDFPLKEMRELRNYSFVVADIGDETEATEFAMAAKVAGVAYNMVDKPELCQFQFGAIVNRSPVIVSISTSGAAPVLAQTIRQRIESILPESLGAWGAIARRIRKSITHAIHDSSLRRAVWQRFAGLAMGGTAPADHDENTLLASLLEVSMGRREVAILEIPHERDLMTLKSCRILMNANVVYDHSRSNFVKSLMRREAEHVDLDPWMPVERHDDQNRNVVICVAADLPEAWQAVIDLPEREGYRQFP
jgi:uroporphyrin-III C-methyltransferase/precorrin-2 dehydrogenase/sirohydrochlorin ferrochelatase